jgi:hypothetical protein
MRYAVTGAIAVAALLGAVSMAVAQGRGDREGVESRGSSAPAARAQRGEGPRAPRAQLSPRDRQSSPGRERAAPERRFYRERQAEPRLQRERQQTQRRRKAAESAQRRERRSRQRAEQQERVEQRRQEQRQVEERRRQQRTEQRREVQRKEQSRTTQSPDRQATRQAVKRVEATNEQRTRVRERLFREHRSDRNRDKDRIRGIRPIVGVHIARRHRLHPLPLWVIEFAPIYRGYRYVWVEDTICIVDPETYVIVDVLPASSQRADLTLTPEQMRFVYAEVPKDTSVDVRIRLALGAEIPRGVALYTFPDHVLARIPKLAGYRYVVVDDEVVIVDPADYAVVLVISD